MENVALKCVAISQPSTWYGDMESREGSITVKSAILVIGVQHALFDANPRPFEADEVVQRINNVTAQARTTGVPVIFIQSEHPGFLEYRSERWQLHSALSVKESDLKIRKTKANSFLDTNLQEILTEVGAKNLIVCGYSSEFCIDSTVRYASALGYTIQLVSDAHTTHDKEHLSAMQIREHHNITLSKGPTVSAVQSTAINLEG